MRAVLVVDDPLARDGLLARLGDIAVGDATTDEEVGEVVDRSEANAVLWDLGASGSIDAELGAKIEALPVPVVALAPALGRENLLGPALAAGLAGIVARNTSPEALRSALETALHGLFVLDHAFAPEVGTGLVEPSGLANATEADTLTPREQEVVQLMAEGLSNKQIADRLGISTHTAKFHVNAVLGKLGASTRTEAVVRALQRGVVML